MTNCQNRRYRRYKKGTIFILVLSVFDESVGKVYVAVPRWNPDIRVGKIRKFSNMTIQLDFSCAREHVR